MECWTTWAKCTDWWRVRRFNKVQLLATAKLFRFLTIAATGIWNLTRIAKFLAILGDESCFLIIQRQGDIQNRLWGTYKYRLLECWTTSCLIAGTIMSWTPIIGVFSSFHNEKKKRSGLASTGSPRLEQCATSPMWAYKWFVLCYFIENLNVP